MQVTIKALAGGNYQIEVQPSDSVSVPFWFSVEIASPVGLG